MPMGYISIDLDYKILKRGGAQKHLSPPKSVTNQKRDIVDTFLHASRAFGHSPMLGLAFSITWEMESKD
jgi:hypothetical protein